MTVSKRAANPLGETAELWVLSGNQAAGKTTTGRMLAARFQSAAHVEGDDMQNLIVVNRRWPQLEDGDPETGELRGEARAQYHLRVRNACLLGASFVDAGITAVVTDIICGEVFGDLVDCLRGRLVHFVMLRPPVDVLRPREVQRLPDVFRERAIARGEPVNDFEANIEKAIDRTSRVGLWFDPGELAPDAVVDALLARRAEAEWLVGPATV